MKTETRHQVIRKFYTLASDARGIRYGDLAEVWFEMAARSMIKAGIAELAPDESAWVLVEMTKLLREHELHQQRMGDPSARRDIDDMLVTRHLSPMAPEETVRQAVDRIINWEVSVNLDPLVSSAAEALVQRGRREAEARRPWWRRLGSFVAGPSRLGPPR